MLETLILIGKVLAMAGVGFFFLLGLWVLIWGQGFVEKVVREAAGSLGLKSEEPEKLREEWQSGEIYGGLIDGFQVKVKVGFSSKIMAVYAGNPTAVLGVHVVVQAPVGAQFSYKIVRATGGFERSLEHPDQDFNKRCAVRTDDPPSMTAALDDSGLRAKIAAFLKDGAGSAFIDEKGAYFIVFDGHLKGANRIVERVRQTLAVAKGLHERTCKVRPPASPPPPPVQKKQKNTGKPSRTMRVQYFSNSEARVIPCPSCSRKIKAWVPSGMSQMCPHFYCDRCSNVVCRDSDKAVVWKEKKSSQKLLEKVAATLPSCPCGGLFKPGANPKCPFCGGEFKHQQDPVARLDDPYLVLVDGACLFGDEDDTNRPYRVKIGPWWMFR